MNEEIIHNLKNSFYERLNSSFNINVIGEYMFIYDEAFEHLLEDTIRTFNKNSKNRNNIKFNNYKLSSDKEFIDMIFYRHFFSHETLIDNLRSDSPEFKKRVRKVKIEKINKNE